MTIKIFHNPRCSKSRQTLALLEEKGIEPQIIEYLKTPLNAEILNEIAEKLSLNPTQFIRFKEGIAKELDISPKNDKTNEQWFDLIINHPVLLERPIVINGDKAAIGRPPEDVLAIL